MAAAAPAPPALSTSHVADGEDSNLSSPLSEVYDKDDELDDPDTMTLDHPDPEDPEDSDMLSEANDTEAETERLYDTPQVSRQRDLVLSQIDEEDATDTTPTKPPTHFLGGAARDADDSLSDVDMSAPPSSPPEEPSSPIKPMRSPSPDEDRSLPEAKKRKRSPVADRSDSETPLRKRTGSVGIFSQEAAGKSLETPASDAKHTEPKSLQSSAGASPGELDEGAEGEQREDSPAPAPVVTKKMTRNGSKQAKAAIVNGADNQEDEPLVENDVEGRKDDEGVEADVEEDLDAAAKHDEEEGVPLFLVEATNYAEALINATAEKKRVAVEEWSAIEQKFNVFRDRYATTPSSPISSPWMSRFAACVLNLANPYKDCTRTG
ncbi:hypothetical protein IMZ48_43835 [Candidatus Bathyarchaeota archaeon]|nr:hypothetical protein [Candidatus Bathyarchaeota archaeon]